MHVWLVAIASYVVYNYFETASIATRGVGRGVSRASGNPLQFSVYNKVSAVAANKQCKCQKRLGPKIHLVGHTLYSNLLA